jgi:hypothetical protein
MNRKYQDFLQTPGNKWYPVRILKEDYLIKAFSKKVRYFQVPLLDRTGVGYTARIIKEKIEEDVNAPVLMTGDPGVGKSTAISSIARTIDPKFDVDKVAFTLDEFNTIFSDNPDGDAANGVFPQVNMDESAFAAFTDDRLQKEQTELAKNLIISRIHKQIVYFGAPKPKHINSRVRDLATIWIHVSEPEYYLQGYAEVHLPPPEKQSKYGAGKYWEPSYAFTFKAIKGDFWVRYEQKKVAFITKALEGINGYGRKITLEQLETLDRLGLKTDGEKGAFFGVTKNRICQIRHESVAVAI